MKLGIIGTGRMGKALAKTLSTSIPGILWGSRSKERVRQLAEELQLSIQSATHQEALRTDIIIPTLWHHDQITWLKEHEEQLRGKIVINITNPFNATFDDFTLDYNTSSAEELQKLVPSVRMVGAFKNTFWEVFEKPAFQGNYSDVYVTSDDEEAKQIVMEMLQGIPFRIMDGGALKNNRTIERMTLFSRELSKRYGHYPYVSWHLWGNYKTNERITPNQARL
jgi:predicted dinucleotide-binding enzyme